MLDVHEFKLELSGDVEEKLDELFEAGLDDALIHSVDGRWYASFDRMAESREEAIASAREHIDTVEGVKVVGELAEDNPIAECLR